MAAAGAGGVMTDGEVGDSPSLIRSQPHSRAADTHATTPEILYTRGLLQARQLIEQLTPRTLGGHEPLHPLAGEDFTCVNVAPRIGGDHVQSEELAAGLAHAAESADDLAVLAVQEPDRVVLD